MTLHFGKAGYGSCKRKLSADRNILFRRNPQDTSSDVFLVLTKNNGRVTADSSVPNSPKRLSWVNKCTACSAAMVTHSLQCGCDSGVNSRGQSLNKNLTNLGSIWQTEIEAKVDHLPTLIPSRRTICSVPFVVRGCPCSLDETALLRLVLVKWSLKKKTCSSTHSNNKISIQWASRCHADTGPCLIRDLHLKYRIYHICTYTYTCVCVCKLQPIGSFKTQLPACLIEPMSLLLLHLHQLLHSTW